VLAVAAVPASAAGDHRCGALSGADGQVFHIRALGTSCAVARTVARTWYHQQQDADTESPVQDGKGRTWDCRIARSSPGSDTPQPYSKIRCTRAGTVAAFWLRS
jgi:hypothetical protein